MVFHVLDAAYRTIETNMNFERAPHIHMLFTTGGRGVEKQKNVCVRIANATAKKHTHTHTPMPNGSALLFTHATHLFNLLIKRLTIEHSFAHFFSPISYRRMRGAYNANRNKMSLHKIYYFISIHIFCSTEGFDYFIMALCNCLPMQRPEQGACLPMTMAIVRSPFPFRFQIFPPTCVGWSPLINCCAAFGAIEATNRLLSSILECQQMSTLKMSEKMST